MENRIFGYDLVRSVAVMLVLFGHSIGLIYSGSDSFYFSFLSGFFGVELFFVLSGVLIGNILIRVFSSEDVFNNLKKFFIRRWLRTLPLYYLMLLIYWIGNLYFDSIQNDDVALWKYIFFIQNFFNIQPTFFGVSWSLCVEEWFYVLFPTVLLLIKKILQKCSNYYLFVISIFVFTSFFLLVRIFDFNDLQFTFYEGVRKITFYRLDSISYGILVAVGIHYLKDKVIAYKYFLFVLGLIVLLFNQYFIIKDFYIHLNYFNTIYYSILGLGLAMLFPFFFDLKFSEGKTYKVITFTSKISYSLYLVHWLVYKVIMFPLFNYVHHHIKFLAFLIFSFLIAFISYELVEKPILKFRGSVQ
ncbi:MAG: acyltransferase [Bacteroidetes bacterium]|nr:acyltransferase [Bacteroidota bacterium]